MNLRLLPALLGAAVLLFHDALAQDASPTESTRPRSNSSSSPPSTTTTPAVATCEQVGLVSVYVVGAPNAFCVQSNTCNSNYIGACPGANAVDVLGVAFPRGSCCASLEGTGEVGCVDLDLIAGDVQCVRHAGSGDSAVVIDPATLTPTPTTTAPTPTTTSPSPTSQLPSPTPFFELTNEPDATSSTPVSTTNTPSPVSTTVTSSPPSTTTPAQTVIITSMSMSSAGSGNGGDEDTEPEAGDEPTSAPPVSTPAASVTDLSSLEPITEPPSASAQTNSVVESSGKGNGNSNTQNSGSGNASSSSSAFTSFVNSDVVLALVLGSVATVAVILGAFILRRRSSSSITSSSTTSNSVFSRKHNESDAPPLTLDGDDDLYEDLRFQANEAFSPIQVQPSYAASTTPGHDRPSYFL